MNGTPKSYSTKVDSGYAVTLVLSRLRFALAAGWRNGAGREDDPSWTLEVKEARYDTKPAVELYTANRVDWLQGILGVTQFARVF